MKISILLVVLCMMAAIADAEEKIPQWQSEFVSSSIKSAVIHICSEQSGVASDPKSQSFVGLIHALALIDTPESLKALVDLSDYYLGSVPAHDLSALITGKGLKIKPLLEAKKKTAVTCINGARCLSTQDRNRRIDYWIGFIEKGKKIDLIP